MSAYNSNVNIIDKILFLSGDKIADRLFDYVLRLYDDASEEVSQALEDLPYFISTKIGEYGTGSSPYSGLMWKGLSSRYKKKKREYFKTNRSRKSLVGGQSFYSYSGDLYWSLRSTGLVSFYDLSKFMLLMISVNGGRNYFTPKFSNRYYVRKKIKEALEDNDFKKIKLKIKFSIVSSKFVWRDILGDKNAEKLLRNEPFRPILEPTLKYYMENVILKKINSIL